AAAKPNRSGRVEAAQVDGVTVAGPFPLLRENERLAVLRQDRFNRPIESGQLALLTGDETEDAVPGVLAAEEHAPVLRDVLKRHVGWKGRPRSAAPRERHIEERTRGPPGTRREPELVARPPDEPLLAPEAARERPLVLPVDVDHRDGAAVVTEN